MKQLNNAPKKVNGYIFKALTLFMVIGITACSQAQSQTAYKLSDGSHIKVSGTSNMHDWEMQSKSFLSEGNFIMKAGQLHDISSLNFILQVNNLKSKDKLMDTRAYKALKAEQFNKITFKLLEATVVPGQKLIKAIGNLTIGGVTNKIALQTSYVLNADESITCKGSKSIKMSDYKIKAPSFMMGALKTGDEVIIDLLLKLKN
ncbi:YceI family protein [Daejeonella oryzae]|uniref:YceI family protein n=1 Tax=Daejeonella oryzae TaxID=1122943 RepID=UPI0004261798|nr:YceI family protein [Daejeonella oryzae]